MGELSLVVGEALQGPIFKKTNMHVAQLEASAGNSAPRTQLGSKIKNSPRKPAAPSKKPAKKHMFWKSSPKKTSRKFGVKLDPQGEDIPEILLQTIPCLEENALTLQGIFRESAPALEVEDKVKKFENCKELVWAEIENQHVVAGVLMAYLLQLPEPLIPFDLYDSFIAAEETVTDRDERASFINKLLKTLPPANRMILQYLIRFLNKLTEHADVNMMTAHNLGIVFGPALLRKEVEDVKQIINDSPHVINSIKIIVEEYTYFFEHGELLGEKYFEPKPPSNETKSNVEEATGKPSRNPQLFQKFMENEEAFLAFQDELSSLLQLLKKNIQLILSDLETPSNFTPEDIQSLNTLINSFHCLIDNPDVDEENLNKEVISLELASNVIGQCKTLKIAFRAVLDRVNTIEAEMDESALDGQSVYIEANLELSQTIERMKETFDRVQSTLLTKRGSSVDKHLSTVRRVIHTISENIRITCVNALKRELAKQQSLAGAVAIARVARAVIQALTNQSLEYVSTPVSRPAISVTTNPADLTRLKAVAEVMEHAFKEIESVIVSIQSRVASIFSVIDSRPLVQLLVGVKKYINTYLTSKPADETKSIANDSDSSETDTFSDASLPDVKSEANRHLTEFRSLLNNILMEVDSVTNFQQANRLALLGEKCRTVVQMDDNQPRRRVSRQQSMGRLLVIKKLCSDSFDDIRGYMFQANRIISQSENVAEIADISQKIGVLNDVLREYKDSQ